MAEQFTRNEQVVGSIPTSSSSKKVSFVYRTKETFLSDAFLFGT